MSTINAVHTTTDQNWQDGTTTVWFEIETDDEVYSGEYGVVFCGTDDAVLVNGDGEPVSRDNAHIYGQILDFLEDYAKQFIAD